MKLFRFLILAVVVVLLNGCCCLLELLHKKGSVETTAQATATPEAKTVKVDAKAMKDQAAALSSVGETTQTSEGIKISLKGDFTFAKGKSELSLSAVQSIAKVADQLKKYPTENVTVTGYTDNSGNKSGNLKLSKQRANAVKVELVKDGVSADRITAQGKGEADPVAPNDTPENMAKNRRTEMLIK